MIRHGLRSFLLYAVCLVSACFLNIHAVLGWYEARTNDWENDSILRGLEATQAFRDRLGIGPALDAMDCSLSFLFNESYKNTGKCPEEETSPRTTSEPSGRLRWAPARPGDVAAWYRPVPAIFQGRSGEARVTTVAGPGESQTMSPLVKANVQSVLVIGDSLALGLAQSFQRALTSYASETVTQVVGKVSSGLCNPRLFDWQRKVGELIDEHKPDMILIVMGVNDANNNIRVGDARAFLNTPSWGVTYQSMVEEFLGDIASHGIPAFWVGLPIVRDEEQVKRIQIANNAARRACDNVPNCHFIDIWTVLADQDGNYTKYKKNNEGYNVQVRERDGIHFSPEGGMLLSRYILDVLSNYVELSSKTKETTSRQPAPPAPKLLPDTAVATGGGMTL